MKIRQDKLEELKELGFKDTVRGYLAYKPLEEWCMYITKNMDIVIATIPYLYLDETVLKMHEKGIIETEPRECDYCSVGKCELEIYETKDDSASIKELEINYYPDAKTIQVHTKTKDDFNLTFGINDKFVYCPMCGKRL